MKKILIGTVLGSAITLAVMWGLGFKQQSKVDEWSLTEQQRGGIKRDPTWFARLEGYPELVYKDTDLVAAITKPDKVSVYRVGVGSDIQIAKFGLSSKKVATIKDASIYSWILSSPTSMTGISACLFEPGFAVEFERKGSSYFALICYSCMDIIFFDEAGEQVSGWGMTYEAAFALIDKFHQQYPDDTDVKNIKF